MWNNVKRISYGRNEWFDFEVNGRNEERMKTTTRTEQPNQNTTELKYIKINNSEHESIIIITNHSR